MPSTLTDINSNAFTRCTSLEEINIPSTVKYIGRYAFNGCTKIKKIVLPSAINYIDYNVFQNCSGLQEIKFTITSYWQIHNASTRSDSYVDITDVSKDYSTEFMSTYTDCYWQKTEKTS